MAVGAYGNDLTTIATGDLNYDAGTWDESSDGGWDTAGAMVDDENLWYTENSTNTGEAANSCTSAQYTKDGTGSGTSGPGTIMYVHTAAFTVPTNGAIIIHHLWAAPTSLNIYAGTAGTAEAGVSALVGDDLADFDVFYASGSDKAPAPEGGWATFAIDPTLTPDTTVGTAPTTTTMVGMAVAATAQARGNPNAVQAIRYGRCTQEYTDGEVANPATFAGYAAVDNAAADRFNLLKNIEGGYKAQGLISLGLTTTLVYFDDSNVNISLANNLKVSSAFNRIEVHHASSTVNWTAVNITSLGTVSRGTFEMIDNATVAFNTCVFTDMSTFIFQSNATLTSSTFRRCEVITQDGATFTDTIFDDITSSVSLTVTNLAVVTGCTFNSDGSNHAIDLGTITTNTGVSWDNFLNDYAVTNGSTGNEAVLVSVDNGVTLTINVTSRATSPTYYNTGTGTVSVVVDPKNFKFTLSPTNTAYEWRIYTVTALGSLAGSVEIDGEESATVDNQTYSYTYSVDTNIAVQIIDNPSDYVENITYYILKNADQDVTILLKPDENN